ncbi:BAH-domain-containing protein, partial [Piedraia hortae CBS 480.64]
MEAAPAVDVSTYGTRSRTRGAARPNYAEDADTEVDVSTVKTSTPVATPAAKTAIPVSKKKAARDSLMGPDATQAGASHAKEATTTAPTRKRKAASTTQSAAATPAPSVSSASVRKTAARHSSIMTFSNCNNCLNEKGELVADDGTRLGVNDNVYLVAEPPSEPYYICRIMQFLHSNAGDVESPVDWILVNWWYRPQDCQRFNSDTRMLYATMQSEECPLSTLRGKCTVKHRSEITSLEDYRRQNDCFYFSQFFDRFIRRSYECIPVDTIVNVQDAVKKALNDRYKYVVVETGRVKELTSAVKTCKSCTKYCASDESVDCAICHNSYHMNCVDPPLPRKPTRGFAWACAPCSRASDQQDGAKPWADSLSEEGHVSDEPVAENKVANAPGTSTEPAVETPMKQSEALKVNRWQMRYFGIHARPEDAFYDDSIYPRASSRIGPRHQANVPAWQGHPADPAKPSDTKKRTVKGGAGVKGNGKAAKDGQAGADTERGKGKRHKKSMGEIAEHLVRGEDYPNDDERSTSKLLFKMPDLGSSRADNEAFIDDYMNSTEGYAKRIGVPPFGANFLDKALELLKDSNYVKDAALEKLAKVDRRKDLHEPLLSKHELIKFEEGVAKFGSEHRLVRLHMRSSLPHADIVRFYYLWKKTPKGREIWGKFSGRKGSKHTADKGAAKRVQDELGDDQDDSAFDNDKAQKQRRGFVCKFCNALASPQWRRAPGISQGQTAMVDVNQATKEKEKREKRVIALCLSCANLWRKYAVQWEEPEDLLKKAVPGNKGLQRRKAEEIAIQHDLNAELTALPSIEHGHEPPKKKAKSGAADKIKSSTTAHGNAPLSPVMPTRPTWKQLPCAVCKVTGETVECCHCKLTVHKQCFGLSDLDELDNDWTCEQCQNDAHPEVSTDYSCCLCLTERTHIELVDLPKVSHKKKNEREREKERLEKELADGMRAEYCNKQSSMNRPEQPREPLKRTIGNNWVHVHCAVWTPEIRFSNAQKLELAEGFQFIPSSRFEVVCKLCKNKDHDGKTRENAGACVSCHQCHANFHVSCALEAGCQLGFDVTPVKNSRRDQIKTVTIGSESGTVTAAIWCKDHVIKSMVHPINELVDDTGRTAIQVFTENFKQADLTLTGTARKANLAQQMAKEKAQPASTAVPSLRRGSIANVVGTTARRGRAPSNADARPDEPVMAPPELTEHRCVQCDIDVSPRWHPAP